MNLAVANPDSPASHHKGDDNHRIQAHAPKGAGLVRGLLEFGDRIEVGASATESHTYEVMMVHSDLGSRLELVLRQPAAGYEFVQILEDPFGNRRTHAVDAAGVVHMIHPNWNADVTSFAKDFGSLLLHARCIARDRATHALAERFVKQVDGGRGDNGRGCDL